MGNYSDYLEQVKDEPIANGRQPSVVDTSVESAGKTKRGKVKAEVRRPKLTFNERRELETIDDEIDKMERRLTELESLIANSTSDYTALQEYMDENEILELELLEKLERQEYLTEKDRLSKS